MENSQTSAPDRILFGSCNSQFHPQPLWPTIISRNASAFVFGGDAVYADSKHLSQDVAATPAKLDESYQALLNTSAYQEFMKQKKTAIVGTWDDHDFGINNGDKTYPFRQEAAEHFFRFIKESNRYKNNDNKSHWSTMEKRVQDRKGVYSMVVFDFDTEGDPLITEAEMNESTHLSEKSFAIYMLDVRYNKTPWKKDYWSFSGEYDGDFLGDEQWQWFEASIAKSTARVNIVVCALQVHTDRWFNGETVEEWSRYPLAQHRLYQNLLRPNVRSPILISGDVHMGEYLRRDCTRPNSPKQEAVDSAKMRSLVEVTTSGMTHSWGTTPCVGPPFFCPPTYMQLFLKFAMHINHINHAWRNVMDNEGPSQEGAKRRVQYTLELNFAEFEFDWDNGQVKARLWGDDNRAKRPLLSNTWTFDQLSGDAFEPTGKLKEQDFEGRLNQLQVGASRTSGAEHLVAEDDWICLPHRGTMSPFVKVLGASFTLGLSFAIFLAPVPLTVFLLLQLYRKFSPRKLKIA